MKKAIVTGATGFIGKFLVRELLQNDVEVFAVDRVGISWDSLGDLPVHKVECDLSNISELPGIISVNDVDCIFHIAWQGVSNADAKSYDVQLKNVRATLELVEAAHQMNIPSFLTTGSIHEFEAKIEMDACEPVSNLGNMYKTAKLAAHWMGKALAGNYNIRFLCPLIINAYGEQENSARLINSFIRKILNGESPDLSEGSQLYDFVHVSDIAHALYLIAEKGIDGKDYIIGSSNAKPLKDFLTEAGDIVNTIKGGEKVPLGFGKRQGKAVSLPKEAFDTTSLVEDTGFQPRISFNDGIKRTAEWIIKERVIS